MELSNEFEVAAPLEQAWAVLTDLERIAPCLPGAQLQEVEGDEYRGIVKIKVGPITAQYKGLAKFVEKDDEKHRAVLSANGRDTRGQGNASAAITAELQARGDRTHVSVLTDLTITGKVAQFGRGVIGDVSAKLLDQFVQNLETTVLAGDAPATADASTTDASGAEGAAPAAVSSNGAGAEASTVREQSAQTTQMLASEIKKIWEEEGSEASGSVRVEREALPPRPDLLVTGSSRGAGETGAPAGGARKIESAEAQPIDLLDTAGSSMLKRLLPLVGALAVVVLVLAIRRRRRR
jgi:carbon monoxide dehydrogenase subunit G